MAGAKEIRTKIKSIGSTRKITKAMEMVAASKMRRAQDRMQAARPYADKMRNVVSHLAFAHSEYHHPYMTEREEVKAVGYIICSSDRGLCGGINSNIVREIKQYVAQGNRANIKIFAIGEKGPGALVRPFPDLLNEAVSELALPMNYATVMAVPSKIHLFSQNDDRIIIFYNEFQSMITYVIRKMELMPRKRFLETIKY